MTREKPNAQPQSTAATEWRKGWTPWGTPCSVRVENGQWLVAHATEKRDCPLGRLATGNAASPV